MAEVGDEVSIGVDEQLVNAASVEVGGHGLGIDPDIAAAGHHGPAGLGLPRPQEARAAETAFGRARSCRGGLPLELPMGPLTLTPSDERNAVANFAIGTGT
jgi:hypothetical protein